jgi:acyl carrier protein
MLNLFKSFIIMMMHVMMWFRYRVTVKGLENVTPEKLHRKGGSLVLPSHPTMFVDPVIVGKVLWPLLKFRPLVVEYMYYNPALHWIMKLCRALPVPNFYNTSNSYKKKKSDEAIEELITSLKGGDSFLIYPAGNVRKQAREVVGGSSGVHKILRDAPDTNVVLVRVTGLWGSSFSRAHGGRTPPMFPTILSKLKYVLGNFIFFTPRRDVTIEIVVNPEDFPYGASRIELNAYLEEWYNRPFPANKEGEKAEPLTLVSYSIWKKIYNKVKTEDEMNQSSDYTSDIPDSIRDKVLKEVSHLSGKSTDSITADMNLATDLGLDSLDIAELISFLNTQFDVKGIQTEELSTVGKMMAYAAGTQKVSKQNVDVSHNMSLWEKKARPSGERVSVPKGKTIIEVLLRTCDRYPSNVACADNASGILSYSDIKLRVILIANYLKTLPDERIGIMLPSSVGANILTFACQLVGKVPVMVNWTVGPKHLDQVIELSGIKTVLSSWAFIDRLENVDFGTMTDLIVTLEDVRRKLNLGDKLRAKMLSRKSCDKVLRHFNADEITPDTWATLLFTSGTEGLPKGVPLSHKNILENQRNTLDKFEIFSEDVIFAILPPFHSFGFAITGIMPFITGTRVVFSPDPTDSEALVRGIDRWKASIFCSAPTFLKGVFSVAKEENLKSIRYFICGAEKTSEALYKRVADQEGNAKILEGYGITECSPVLTFNPTGDQKNGVGKPIDCVDIGIVDQETYGPVQQGERGRILAKGASVFSGYLSLQSASPFVRACGEQWYDTGDIGYFDHDNNLHIVGRLKRFIKVGGEMVSLQAIEEALYQEGSRREWELSEEEPSFAVCGKEIPGEKPLITLFSNFPLSVQEANDALKEFGFSNLLKISDVIEIEMIPISGTGKVAHRLLEERYINDVSNV